MNRSIIWRLIAKDLYLHRWLFAITIAGGFAAMFLNSREGVPDFVGILLLVTAVVAAGIFIAMFGVSIERQTKTLLFVLSLPLSPMQYAVAKVAASLIGFLIPWGAIGVTLVGLTIAFDPPPDGTLPFTVAMMFFFLASFCALLALLIATRSDAWPIAGIMLTNLSVAVYLNVVPRLPGFAANNDGPVPVWSATALTTIGIEIAVIVLSLAIAFFVQAKRKDFV
jgi:ABC-type transport system involved in multi-copper enzyme maturation permease subunit